MPVSATAASSQAVTIADQLDVREISERQAALAARPPRDWSPADFAAFVTEEIEHASGEQLPCQGAQAILEGFWERHGAEQAVRIARAAFELYGGWWAGAPVTVRRFMQSNDEFFAGAISAALDSDTAGSTKIS